MKKMGYFLKIRDFEFKVNDAWFKLFNDRNLIFEINCDPTLQEMEDPYKDSELMFDIEGVPFDFANGEIKFHYKDGDPSFDAAPHFRFGEGHSFAETMEGRIFKKNGSN